jgi:hypothetical protein
LSAGFAAIVAGAIGVGSVGSQPKRLIINLRAEA